MITILDSIRVKITALQLPKPVVLIFLIISIVLPIVSLWVLRYAERGKDLKREVKLEPKSFMQRFSKLLAVAIALIILMLQEGRLGMSVIAFFVSDLLIKETKVLNVKNFLSGIFAIALFFIGHFLSLNIALSYAAPSGLDAYTFHGGFLGGVIELETYILFTLLPLKSAFCRDFLLTMQYLSKKSAICFVVGGLIQGSYMAGWQSLIYV